MKRTFKKITSMLLAVMLIVGAMTLTPLSVSAAETQKAEVSAASGTTGDCTWSFDSDTGLLTISGSGAMEDYGDWEEVTPWDSFVDDIKSVVIENGVTNIGRSAFEDCYNLISVTIPNSVTVIDYRAFEDCSSLTSVTIPDCVTLIGYYAFNDCSSLASVTIGNGVNEIDYNAFENCTRLTSVTIPDSVETLRSDAFSGCTSLASVTIGNGVNEIGYSAFENCTSLTSITIPESVEKLRGDAFSGCTSLASIEVNENNQNYCSIDGVLFNIEVTELVCYPAAKADENYTIPDSVTSIGYSAFEYCTSLSSVKIPDSVTSIGRYAFYGTAWYDNQPDGLVYAGKVVYGYKGEMPENTTLILKDGTKGIASSAFDSCASLASVTIPDSVTSIGSSAFDGCTSLTNITIPDSVTEIGGSAFEGCTSLTSITIPDNVKSIEQWAFYDCASLTEVTVPGNLVCYAPNDEEWSWDAFGRCDNLKAVNISETSDTCNMYDVSEIFSESVEILNIPSGVSNIVLDNSYQFEFDKLKSVNVDENNDKYMSENGVLFSKDKTQLLLCPIAKEDKSYSIPNDVSLIGDYAFYECDSITSLTIPDSVESIGEEAFYYCENLSSITIPDNVTYVGYNAFAGTAWLDNQPDGVLYIGKTLYSYIGEMPEDTVITLREDTVQICDAAFWNRYQLKDIQLNDGLKYIGRSAFYCSPAYYMVPNNENLTSINIPDSVTYIGSYAFYGCPSLKSVTLSENVTEIGWSAFGWYDYFDNGCSLLGTTDNFTIYGYTGTAAEAYVNDENENTFAEFKFISIDAPTSDFEYELLEDGTVEIVGYNGTETEIVIPSEIDGYAVTSIGNGAFYDCGLTSVTIADGISKIGDQAFQCCANLENIIIPASVKEIGIYAFDQCSALSDVTIPDGVESIGAMAFCRCGSLKEITIPESVTEIGEYAFGYDNLYGDEKLFEPVKVEGFSIKCCSGTAAEAYAKENSIEFVALDDEPDYKFGDANGDGSVNAKDRMMLTRYLAKWTGYESIDKTAADVNNDGDINAKDRMILTRHLAKWQGYETLPLIK